MRVTLCERVALHVWEGVAVCDEVTVAERDCVCERLCDWLWLWVWDGLGVMGTTVTPL